MPIIRPQPKWNWADELPPDTDRKKWKLNFCNWYTWKYLWNVVPSTFQPRSPAKVKLAGPVTSRKYLGQNYSYPLLRNRVFSAQINGIEGVRSSDAIYGRPPLYRSDRLCNLRVIVQAFGCQIQRLSCSLVSVFGGGVYSGESNVCLPDRQRSAGQWKQRAKDVPRVISAINF